MTTREVNIPIGTESLEATLTIPDECCGIVAFAHGSGSSRHSPRNRYVAETLNRARLATLLTDLLTPAEEQVDLRTRALRFDIAMLAERLASITGWLRDQPDTRDLGVGLFGSSTGGGAALVAAADCPDDVRAVVSRGGRPDLAKEALPKVRAATLLIVGGRDEAVIELNRKAFGELQCGKRLEVVQGAAHLFEEPGTLEEVARLTASWFVEHLGRLPRDARR